MYQLWQDQKQSGRYDGIVQKKTKSNWKQPEYSIFLAGLILAAGGLFFGLLLYLTPLRLEDVVWSCAFHRVTGIYCPGCGGTRAVIAFTQGHFVQSFFFHPVVLYSILLYLIFMFRGFICIISKGRYEFMKFRPGYVYMGILIILAQFLIKNILFIGYGIDWL